MKQYHQIYVKNFIFCIFYISFIFQRTLTNYILFCPYWFWQFLVAGKTSVIMVLHSFLFKLFITVIILGKDIRVVSHYFLSSFEFRVVFLLRLLSKVKEPNLPLFNLWLNEGEIYNFPNGTGMKYLNLGYGFNFL